ncbi:MAG: hypothetical protein MR691_14955 [Clostridium sp.]|nr:hypothetical protein [Clostridium sp.]
MIGNYKQIIQWLIEKEENSTEDDYTIYNIKEYKEKRSLNANSYCWVLLGKISDSLGITKEEVYREYIKDKGIYRIITMNNDAVPTFIKVWEEKGLGWICETSETNVSGLTDVIAYYGTSSYNTKQMANFIDYVVSEAKTLNIETLRPTQLYELKKAWQ